MDYRINLKNLRKKEIYRLSGKFCGTDGAGNEIACTNYYLTVNGGPFFGIVGECHYSRIAENQWEDSILKMKMGGLNVISMYCFWNHHEETEGCFRFDGSRNVRKFIELCQKHGMYVIIRIGPFDHGEVRNGGIPDWMYGKPFEVRALNEGWLSYTRKLYRQYAKQFEGLYYKDGGPIIGTQIENEYMHSAAPWEMTTGVTNEWLPGGSDGTEYMKELKKIAQEEGIITPFYTCTGWGGAAAAPDEMISLWGGYAYQPWIFYDYQGEHPLTEEYIYRDNHNNAVPETYNFRPAYAPESLPYACCEMGGGMQVWYNYRFQIDYESVDAMANIKMASGCNLLGYYMYRGGSNPKGVYTPYLNEHQCPKISYDFQAPVGEFGQLRPSYHRLRALHLFAKHFGGHLCGMTTVLPEGSQEIEPGNVDTLRFAVRTDGRSGYLFLNNYQDHCRCKNKEDESVTLELADRNILMTDISLAAGEEAILPFMMDVEGRTLVCATAQPLSVIRTGGRTVYFFFIPQGMSPRYVWEDETVTPPADRMSSFTVKENVEIVTLTRQQSLTFYELEKDGQPTAALCSDPLIFHGSEIEVESPPDGCGDTTLLFYPEKHADPGLDGAAKISPAEKGIFKGLRICWQKDVAGCDLEFRRCGFGRYTIQIPELCAEYKDALLQIEYRGDIGQLFADGELISDNFSNDTVWEIGLNEAWKPEMGRELTICITPNKKHARVDVSSTMAGRTEQIEGAAAELIRVRIQPVRSVKIKCTDAA